MDEKVKIVLAGQEHEVEAKPLTLIFKDPDITQDIQYPDRFKLGPQECWEHLKAVVWLHPDTEMYVRMVFPDYKPPRGWDLDWIKTNEGSGYQHVVGRIDFTLKAIDIGLRFVWAYPEASLHPKAQCQIADVLISLIDRASRRPSVPHKVNRPDPIKRKPRWP